MRQHLMWAAVGAVVMWSAAARAEEGVAASASSASLATAPALSAAAAKLAGDLLSADPKVYERASRDATNGDFGDLGEADRLAGMVYVLRAVNADPKLAKRNLVFVEYLPRYLGASGKQAVPALLEVVGNTQAPALFRQYAVLAVSRIGSDDADVVKALLKAAEAQGGKNSEVLQPVVERLGAMGAAAAPAKGMLRGLLMREASPAGTPVNEAWLQDAAFEALGRIMAAAYPEEKFETMLRDKDVDARAAAHVQIRFSTVKSPTTANGKVGTPLTAEATAAVRAALLEVLETHGDDYERRAALVTLTAVKPGGEARMVKAILGCMNERGDHLAEYYPACEALRVVAPTDAAAVPLLLAVLKERAAEPRGIVTMPVVQALTRYGKTAQAALPDVMAGFDRLIVIKDHGFATEEVGDYMLAMAALGPEDVEVGKRILDLMDADHPLNHPKPPYQPVARYAGAALATMGLPADAMLHKRAVALVAAGLGSPASAEWAIKTLAKTDTKALAADADAFVPGLMTIAKAELEAPVEGAASETRQLPGLEAIRALEHLGGAAREALPVLKKLAERTPFPPSYSAAMMHQNMVTEEAKKAVAGMGAGG